MADDQRSATNAAFLDSDFLYGGNAVYVEQLYAKFARDPASVDPSWREFFARVGDPAQTAVQAASGASWQRAVATAIPSDELTQALDGNWAKVERTLERKLTAAKPAASPADIANAVKDSIRAIMMIRAYRIQGHLKANLDPLGLGSFGPQADLDPANYGFKPEDFDRPIFIDNVLGLEYASVRQMVDILERTYCGTFAVEFMHISDPEQKSWLQQRIEGPDKGVAFSPEGKKAILGKLIEAETLERFLHKRFPGTKRFGLDGGEAMVPALEQVIKRGGSLGVDEIIIGMPHRGRLNVLAAVMGKPYRAILNEFQSGGAAEDEYASGDVKYHLGHSSDRVFDGNTVHLSLTPNPSHLEAVNPVVLGKARAKQTDDILANPDAPRTKVLPLLLHGDAAFAGQGVIMECFALSGLKGYRTGGTLHFIVNNQIGFTTSPHYSRSSAHPTDVALMVQCPIFHVNGDDPEAVVYAAKVATEFRQKFAKDVVIDMYCYRRYGHNEGDEPMFTQPLMYKKIRGHASTREIYGARLIAEGLITQAEMETMVKAFEDFLDAEFEAARTYTTNGRDWLDGKWRELGLPLDDERKGTTGVALDHLRALGTRISTLPATVAAHPTVKRVYEGRLKMMETGEGLDWAMGEALAYATLLDEGHPIRLSGQDSRRGTFSHRHSDIVDQDTEERYTPLANIRPGQANFEAIDSLLSEEAVLGYEYGYSLSAPEALVMWEAQFGDFANGAQVLFDQFISSAERKWLRMSGLVCLLPHGYEGQGPEHSSARLERFLQLCAEDNMQVANCTTPANYFHILRRQLKRSFRKPLILMTPKSLLRHKRATSKLSEMAEGSTFHRVLWDDAETAPATLKTKLRKPKDIKRVVICSGKVYYDLLEAREEKGRDDVYLMRVEQFYPFPGRSLMKELERFKHAEMVWCQEEPKNMGGWFFMDPNLEWVLDKIEAKHRRARYVGRAATASTATGLAVKHNRERDAFLNEALG
jgi:2-oxoglutarate dehydrogenase E1 component